MKVRFPCVYKTLEFEAHCGQKWELVYRRPPQWGNIWRVEWDDTLTRPDPDDEGEEILYHSRQISDPYELKRQAKRTARRLIKEHYEECQCHLDHRRKPGIPHLDQVDRYWRYFFRKYGLGRY